MYFLFLLQYCQGIGSIGMPPFLYILLRFSLGHNTLLIFLYYLLFWKKNLLPPYWYKVSQKLYANTYDTKTCDIMDVPSHHASDFT